MRALIFDLILGICCVVLVLAITGAFATFLRRCLVNLTHWSLRFLRPLICEEIHVSGTFSLAHEQTYLLVILH